MTKWSFAPKQKADHAHGPRPPCPPLSLDPLPGASAGVPGRGTVPAQARGGARGLCCALRKQMEAAEGRPRAGTRCAVARGPSGAQARGGGGAQARWARGRGGAGPVGVGPGSPEPLQTVELGTRLSGMRLSFCPLPEGFFSLALLVYGRVSRVWYIFLKSFAHTCSASAS